MAGAAERAAPLLLLQMVNSPAKEWGGAASRALVWRSLEEVQGAR